ncbi:hypothetical protein KDW_25770 [Dictyobacter vulcani]|uniref:Uncharacterized protein n=1 Tax=Dictyobacter vulcani TaxID=2607529 RepID=A0A5J4KKM6_9CHLR|nr:WD40 repeat domain-containing protein [Dictyobacter vulcani]GER88415.1 hypothetical protein KDW_25770 [Dictyobacter vulcani]
MWLKNQQQDPTLHTFQQLVDGVTWSPDGKSLAALTADGALYVWNTLSYKNTYRDRARGNIPIGAIAWSPNGQYIATSDPDYGVRIWDVRTWTAITAISNNQTVVDTLSWSPDSKLVATGSLNKRVCLYKIIANSHAELVSTYEQYRDEVTTLAWSANGKYIASGSLDGTVHIWIPSTGVTQMVLTNQTSQPITAVAWSPESQRLAVTFGPHEDNQPPMNPYMVKVFNVPSGSTISTYTNHSNYIASLAWSSDGAYIASASDDTTVHIWRPTQAQTVYIYRGHTARVRNVVWAPDNIRLATTSEDQTLQIWKKP